MLSGGCSIYFAFRSLVAFIDVLARRRASKIRAAYI